MHDVAYGIDDAQRISCGSDLVNHFFDHTNRGLREREISDGRARFLQRPISRVRADPDDLDFALCARERHNEALAKRTPAREFGFHKRLVHDRYQRRSRPIVLIDIAPEQDWNLHVREEAAADRQDKDGLHWLSRYTDRPHTGAVADQRRIRHTHTRGHPAAPRTAP